jgi:hypothetical protein
MIVTYCVRFWPWLDLPAPLWMVTWDGRDYSYLVMRWS